MDKTTFETDLISKPRQVVPTFSFSDFKALLRDWRNYQKCKLEKANMYNCNFYSGNTIMSEATVSFNTEGEYCLEVQDGIGGIFRVMLTELSGYNLEGRTVTLTRKPELHKPNIILEFHTEEVLEVALSKLKCFIGEMVSEPTPPSSSDSD